MAGHVVNGKHHFPTPAARLTVMEPSSLVAVTIHRSPFLTRRLPVASSQLFSRVTTSSPIPTIDPACRMSPSSMACPVMIRSALARSFSSATVLASAAIINDSLPTARRATAISSLRR
jgi:hypothetical protein